MNAKKLLALVISMLMICAVLPMTAIFAEEDVAAEADPTEGYKYVIVSEGYALTTEAGESYTNNFTYHYAGLAGKQYSEDMELTDDMLWEITENADGSYTISNNGKTLRGSYVYTYTYSYEAQGYSRCWVWVATVAGADSKLELGEETDTWTITNPNGDKVATEIVENATVQSANASNNSENSPKCLAYGNPTVWCCNPNVFVIRSECNKTLFTIIPVAPEAPVDPDPVEPDPVDPDPVDPDPVDPDPVDPDPVDPDPVDPDPVDPDPVDPVEPEDPTPEEPTPEEPTPEEPTPEEPTPAEPEKEVPETGDVNNLPLWTAMFLLSGAVVLVTSVYSRRKTR